MDQVRTLPEFADLTEGQIDEVLDSMDDAAGDENDLGIRPVVNELERLIAAYSERFEQLVGERDGFPEELLSFEPDKPIERVAYDIFSDALHDTLQEQDDE